MRHSDQSYYIAGGKPENGSLYYVKIEGNGEYAPCKLEQEVSAICWSGWTSYMAVNGGYVLLMYIFKKGTQEPF